MQLTHYTSKFKRKKHPIILICDSISYAQNVGSLFRTADAFGIEKLIFCGEEVPFGPKMKKTSRSTEKYVPYEINRDIVDIIANLQKTHHIIALEITGQSKSLHSYEVPTEKPLALVIGNENVGLADKVLNQCHDVVHIEMFGHNSSMNVVQATSVALYELCKQL